MAHIDAEHVGAGLEQPPDHGAVGGSRAKRCEDLDTAQTSHGLFPGAAAGGGPDAPGGVHGQAGRCRQIARNSAGPVRADRSRNPRHLLRRLLFAGFGQLHGPGALLAGVDLEEAGAVEAARQAILGALDGEFLVARAHEGLSRPLAAAVVIERVDVVDTARPACPSAGSRSCARIRSTSPRWSSPRHPCSRARCRPGSRCCCRDESPPRPNCSTGTSPQAPAPAANRRSGERRRDGGDGKLWGSFSEAISIL